METITIPKTKYEELIRDQKFLRNLEAAGVDNWDGYHFGYGDSDDLDMSEEMWNNEIAKFDDEALDTYENIDDLIDKLDDDDLDDDPEEIPTT